MTPCRRVLVVGGGLGIGEKITKFLLQQHRARVVVFSLHVTDEIHALVAQTGRLQIVQGDATSDEARAGALNVVLKFMGGLDSLVCTAGIMGEIQRMDKMSTQKLLNTYNVNLFAPMLLCQKFLPELRKSRGNIIILSSAVDKDIKYAGWIQYCSSKAALTRFIEVLAHEESDVKVYGMYPGLTRTSMVDELISGKYSGIMNEDEIQKFINWDKHDEIEPAEWCANVTAKMSVRAIPVAKNGCCQYYYEYDPHFRVLDSGAKL